MDPLAPLVRQFEGVLVQTAIVFAIEFHVSRASLGGDGKTAYLLRPGATGISAPEGSITVPERLPSASA